MRTHIRMETGDRAEAVEDTHYTAVRLGSEPYGEGALMLPHGEGNHARLIAAAINNDHAELRRLLDAIAPVPDEAEGDVPRFLQRQGGEEA